MNSLSYKTSIYGKRKKTYLYLLKDNFSYSILSLYLSTLIKGLKTKKDKPLYTLADMNISYDILKLGSKFFLKLSLEQAESKRLHFIFSDPYKEADYIFAHIFENEIYDDKDYFEILKSRLSDKLIAFLTDPRFIFDFGEVSFDLSSISLEDVKKAKEYIDFTSYITINIGENIPDIKTSNNIKLDEVKSKNIFSNSIQNELLVIDVMSMDINKYVSDLSYLVLYFAFSNYMKDKMYRKIAFDYQYISEKETLLYFTFQSSNLSLLEKQLPISPTFKLEFKDEYITQALREKNIRDISTGEDIDLFEKELLQSAVLTENKEVSNINEAIYAFLSSLIIKNISYVRKKL